MEKKDRFLCLELFLTFSLLLLVISLLGETLPAYRLYLIFGLVSGFCFSWFIRNKQNQLIRFFMTFAAFGVLAWMIYSILNSSLLYKEVILICIKGGLVLELILSFNATSPPFLTYIQALNIPLFMSYPVFIKDTYNVITIILTLGYFINWLVIFKVKFYELLKSSKERDLKKYYSVYLSVIFFLIIIISSWKLFSKFSLGEIKKGGLFLEEGPGEEAGIDKEYYNLQDKVQEEITRLIPEFSSTEERYEALALLSSLIKESPHTMEVDKAELGLIDYLKKPGPGLEEKDIEDLTNLIKTYVDKKIALNLKETKDNILKQRPLDIKNRISILNRINKMQYSNSFQKVSQYEKELKKNINNSSLDSNVKKDLKELVKQFKAWKTFEIYRKTLESSLKNIDSLEEGLKKEFTPPLHAGAEFTDLLLEIKHIEELSDFKEIDNKLGKLKETVPIQLKNLINNIEQIFDLKLELSLLGKIINLKEKLETSNLSRDKIMELKEDVDNIKDAEDHRNLSKDLAEFKERTEEEKVDISKETEELRETESYGLAKKRKEKVEDILKESVLTDSQRKDFLKEIKKLESAKNSEKLVSDARELEADIDRFLDQGFISKEARDNLITEINEIKDLFSLQVDLKEMFEPVVEMKMMYAIDKALSNLRKDIEKLSKINPQESRILDEHLRKIRNSSTEEELKKSLDNFKEYIGSKELETEEKPQEAQDLGPWQIYILPSRIVVPLNTPVSLKTIAIYNKIFIKELGSELEWFSSDPNVAWVDEKGVVYSLSKGKTKISAIYRGKSSEEAEIVVVDKIAEGIGRVIKKEIR